MSQTETKLELLPCPFCGGEATNKPLQPIVCGCGTWNVTRKQWNNRTNSKDKETIRELRAALDSYVNNDECVNAPDTNDGSEYRPGRHLNCRWCAGQVLLAKSQEQDGESKSQQEGEGA